MNRLLRALPWLVFAACGDPPAAPPPSPAVEAEDPHEKVARLLEAPEAGPDADSMELTRRLDGLEDRLARLEALVADIEEVGIGEADRVRFDPSRTTLDARSVQDALVALATEIREVKEAAVDMGEPGEGLFNLDKQGPLGPVHAARNPPPGGPAPGQPPPGGPPPHPAGHPPGTP